MVCNPGYSMPPPANTRLDSDGNFPWSLSARVQARLVIDGGSPSSASALLVVNAITLFLVCSRATKCSLFRGAIAVGVSFCLRRFITFNLESVVPGMCHG